jgi:signal transduction histidine kinase
MCLTITKKLALSFGSVLLLMALPAVAAVIAYGVASENVHSLQQEALEAAAVGNLHSSVSSLIGSVNDYIITGKDTYRHAYETQRLEVEQRLRELQARSCEEQQPHVEVVRAAIGAVNESAEAILRIDAPREDPQAIFLMEQMDYVHGERAFAELTVLSDTNAAHVSQATQLVDQRRRHGLIGILLSSALAVAVSIGVTTLVMRHVSAPLREITGMARRIAARDFSVRLEAKTKDEVGVLVDAFSTMSEELKRRYEELENFAYVAAHDLKNPLAAIHGTSRVLVADFSEALNEEGRAFLRSIVTSSERMLALIEDLLQFARAGNVDFAKEPVPLTRMLEEIRGDLTYLLKERNAVIIIPPNLPSVTCDPIRLAQVWRNLISNAIKYNDKPQPVVEIGCVANGNQYRLFVRDNGIGVPETEYERVFLPFQRAVSDQKYEGTGIGLPIVKRVVEQHGGRVWIESQLGKGTTMYVTVPRPAAA